MSDYEKLFKMKQDDWVKACAQIDRLSAMCERLADSLKDITAECNSELSQACPNDECDYVAKCAIASVNICDQALAEYRAMKGEKNE